MPLRAGADQVAVAGEEEEGPVGAALALEQPLEHGQRLVGSPVRNRRAVVPADDEVGALALPDLVVDDRLDELPVLLVVGVEAAAVGELHSGVVDRRDDLLDRELQLGLDVDHHERRPVVVRLEPPLAHLPERHRQQPVGDVTVGGRTGLERYVEQRLAPRAASRRPGPRCRGRPPGWTDG